MRPENNSSFFQVNQTDYPIMMNELKNSKKKNSIEEIISEFKKSKIEEPLEKYKSQVVPLEIELFKNLNLEWGVDIISEDIPLIDDKKYYCHLIRTANPDPNKDNFFLIHGFISSGMHFISILPYLIKRYNIFIPDTIGMGLSARPQVDFTSPIQCEEYFINVYHVIIESIFFRKIYNIKEEYYLCGHSLGGFIASRYMLKYPKGIKKVLLLSPLGITDYLKKETYMDGNMSCCFCCVTKTFPALFYPCKLRLQSIYRCCCCVRKLIKNFYAEKVNFDLNEIKRNKDGTEFKVDIDKIAKILGKLGILALEYPDDLYSCVYYIFELPPTATKFPIENQILSSNKIQIIFAFGETDFMDRDGAYRLAKSNSDLYKVFTVKRGDHSFSMQNPKELCQIISQFFGE